MSGAAPSPASAAEALAMLRSAMSYLAASDATAMAAETQAQRPGGTGRGDLRSVPAR